MINYFPHDHHARNDKKILPLIMRMGWEGYGIYWALVEMLYEAGGSLELDQCESIAFAMRSDCDKIKAVINGFSLFTVNGNCFTSDSVLRRLQTIHSKSVKASNSAAKRWGKMSDANALKQPCERNANKRKEKKINSIGENAGFELFWESYGKKRDKKDCEQLWQNLKPEEQKSIMDFIPKYKSWQPDPTYRKDPIRFLKKRTWQDEIPQHTGAVEGIAQAANPGKLIIR